jgi:transposase
MATAIDYTLSVWDGLRVFLEDGRVEIDNNLAENTIRPTAIGKKNWLFIGDAEAGEPSTIVFTVIEACPTNTKGETLHPTVGNPPV